MTDELVDHLTGRKLDGMVAAHVMGWTVVEWERELVYIANGGDRPQPVPGFFCRPVDMLKIVDRMADLGFWWEVKSPFDPFVSNWFAGFTPHNTSGWNGRPDHQSPGKTMMEATARAALKHVFAKSRQEEGESW